jgi:hypothetical protein
MYMLSRLGYIVDTFFRRSPKRARQVVKGMAFNSPNWSQNVLT